MEQQILASMALDREAYETFTRIENSDKDFSSKAKLIYQEIQDYYDADYSATAVDLEILETRLARNYPKHEELFRDIVRNFPNVSVSNVVHEVINLRKDALRNELIGALSASNNDEEVQELIDQYQLYQREDITTRDEASEIFRGLPVEEIVSRVEGDRVKLYPPLLNEITDGGVLRQHHVVVFGRPDLGKTAFAINFTYGFLKQGLTVLYCGNEDPAGDILLRMLTRLVGMTKHEIQEDPARANAIASERNYDRFIFAELNPGTPSEISKLVEEYKPDVLLVDQARNLNMKEDNRVRQLEKACQFVRNIGKKHGMVTVSFTQAGDSAEGKLVLNMGDVDFSNTGIQSTADLMIGIGANEDYMRSGRRMLSFPKNKLSAVKEPATVNFIFEYNKVQ